MEPFYKTAPRPYQQLIVDKTAEMPNLALFLKQGLGKTKIALDTAAKQFLENGVECMVVMSKTAVVENWYFEEIPKHLGVQHQTILYSTKTKRNLPPPDRLIPGVLKVILINFGCARTDHGYNYLAKCLELYKCGFVVDESTLIKNPSAQLTKQMIKLAEKAVYRRIMCGEPAPQGPVDFYSQYKFLDTRIIGVRTFTAFKQVFCANDPVWVNGRQIFRPTGQFAPGAQQIFEDAVKGYTIKLNKEDVLPDLPEKQYIVKKYQLPAEVRKAYDKLRDQFFTEMVIKQDTHEMTATLAISRITRLHQMVAGHLVNDLGGIIPVESGKFEVLKEVLDERPEGSKTIIWAHYRHTIDALTVGLSAAYSPESTRYVYGGLSSKERQDALSAFKTDPKVRYLVANPATAGWGLTLTEADTCVYYSNSYNWEHRDQSEDRIHRIGQESDSVTYYDLVAVDTVEEAILDVLQSKADFAKSIMKDISRWFGPSYKMAA